LNVLANDWSLALLALGSLSFCTLCLTVQTPSITILLDMCHSFLKRITTLSTKEVSIMPVLSQRDCMFSDDGCLAVLALRSVIFMPIEMTEIAKSWITVLRHGLAFNFWDGLALSSAFDSIETFSTFCRWLGMYFQRFQPSSATETYEALRMKMLRSSTELHHSALDW